MSKTVRLLIKPLLLSLAAVLCVEGLGSSLGYAGCLAPQGTKGELAWVSAATIMKYCNGTNWVATARSSGASCAGSSAGEIKYVSGSMSYCDGFHWISMKGQSLGSCGGGAAPGQFELNPGTGNLRFCDGSNWFSLQASTSQTPPVPPTSAPLRALSLFPESARLVVGQSITIDPIAAAGSPAVRVTDRPVSWSSDNTAVATVDSAGRVTLVSPGKAKISASAGGLVAVSSIEGDRVSKIEVYPQSNPALLPGLVTQFWAMVFVGPSQDLVTQPYPLSWRSSDTSILAFDSVKVPLGHVDLSKSVGGFRAIASGKASVTANDPASGQSATVPLVQVDAASAVKQPFPQISQTAWSRPAPTVSVSVHVLCFSVTQCPKNFSNQVMDRASAQKMVDDLNQAYRLGSVPQIAFTLAKYEELVDSNAYQMPDYMAFNDFIARTALVDRGMINLWFNAGLPGSAGQGMTDSDLRDPRGAHVYFDYRLADSWTIRHEVGHVFGFFHPVDSWGSGMVTYNHPECGSVFSVAKRADFINQTNVSDYDPYYVDPSTAVIGRSACPPSQLIYNNFMSYLSSHDAALPGCVEASWYTPGWVYQAGTPPASDQSTVYLPATIGHAFQVMMKCWNYRSF